MYVVSLQYSPMFIVYMNFWSQSDPDPHSSPWFLLNRTDLTVYLYAPRKWALQKSDFKLRRQAFARTVRRPAGGPIQYPQELATPFPTFAIWLNQHVRELKESGYPVSHELDSLHCPPLPHAWSFHSMWAYGCHYTCNTETTLHSIAESQQSLLHKPAQRLTLAY